MLLDGELIGFARTYTEGETTLDTLVCELLGGDYFARPAEPASAPLDVPDLLALFQSDADAAYAQLAALTTAQRYAQALACAAACDNDAVAILARWEAGIARRAA
jgi:hypothetical protein